MQNTSNEPLTEPISMQPNSEYDERFSWISQQREFFGNSSNEFGTYRRHHFSPKRMSQQSSKRSAHTQRRMPLRQTQGYVSAGLLGTNLHPSPDSIQKSEGSMLLYPGLPALAFGSSKNEWLEEALAELISCADQAVEEDIDAPSNVGLVKAEKILKEMARYVGDEPSIYPMDEGSIAIDLRNVGAKSGVLILIEREGSGVLFYRTKKSKGRVRAGDALDLLSEGGLLEIRRVGIQ